MDARFRHIAFATSGWSFAESARMLEEQALKGELRLSHDMPIDYLYAHACELMMKGLILKGQPNCKIQQDFGHRLLELYDELKCGQDTSSFITEVEKAIRTHWKGLLRKARDDYEASLDLDWNDNSRREFGSLTNAQIGDGLPELRKQIQWLAERHGQGNDLFRYHQDRLDQRPVIQRFGLDIDVVRETVYQMCSIFHVQITGMNAR